MDLNLLGLVAVALAFDFINGFHDAANSIATVVSTRVLSPRQAVVWAAFFNFVAFLLFAPVVAMNIAKGVDPHVVDLRILGAGLFGAIVWDLITWWAAIPTSSSHALLGGFAGAAVTKAGFSCLNSGFFLTTTAFILIAPFLGMLLGLTLTVVVSWVFRRLAPSKVDRV